MGVVTSFSHLGDHFQVGRVNWDRVGVWRAKVIIRGITVKSWLFDLSIICKLLKQLGLINRILQNLAVGIK